MFQARCRGYLIRSELKCVQAEYEDIVREVEGSVEHLSWRGLIIPQPHFTDAVKFTSLHQISYHLRGKGAGHVM